jgi:hypothetical protein
MLLEVDKEVFKRGTDVQGSIPDGLLKIYDLNK